MPVLLRAASSPSASAQPEGFAARRNSEPRDLSLALSALRHGDFPRSVAGSELPVCALRSRASPASLRGGQLLDKTSHQRMSSGLLSRKHSMYKNSVLCSFHF